MPLRSSIVDTNQHIGAIGEDMATQYLQNNGYLIRDRNVYSRWGEIDIVAYKKNKVHFIEVKTRVHTKYGLPYEAVRIPKLAHLMRSIKFYILENHLHTHKFQLDVISILLTKDKSLLELKVYENVSVDRFY